MANFLLVLLPLLTLSVRKNSCESTNKTDDVAMRIVGGYYTKPGALPYQASLKYKEEEEHICGAVIVSKTCALTAAHCFDEDDTVHENRHLYTVVAGEHDLWKESRDEQPRKPDAIILHEKYNNPQRANDIAVIKFKKPLIFNDKVNAIKLATPRDKIANKRAIVSGWGVTSFYKDSPSRRLQHVEQMIWKIKDCAKKYGDQFHPGMMCAGWDEGGKDACKGDSGGPLIVGTKNNMTLVGIVSWGINCGTTNPGIYTEVAHYLGWIKAKCSM